MIRFVFYYGILIFFWGSMKKYILSVWWVKEDEMVLYFRCIGFYVGNDVWIY